MNNNNNNNTTAETLLSWKGGFMSYNRELLTEKEREVIGYTEPHDRACLLTEDCQRIMATRRLRIGTHPAPHHGDEVLAIALLTWELDKDQYELIESRDPAVLAECDFRVDVGEGLLDHHGARAEEGVAACTRVFQLLHANFELAERDEADFAILRIMAELVAPTAAVDTGIEGAVSPFPWLHPMAEMDARLIRQGKEPKYGLQHLVDRVSEELSARAENVWASAKAARAAEDAIAEQKDSAVVVFDSGSREAPVKEMLHRLQHPALFYVSPEKEGDWRVLCAADPEKEFSYFSSRKLIPEKYRGLRGEALDEATGIPGGVFCHAAGFIAGFKTREAAVAFAELCCSEEEAWNNKTKGK